VLRAGGEAETTQENIQDWLELEEGVPGFQFVTEKEIIFISTAYVIKFSIYLFSIFLFCFLF
jgi:hypothetical protein